MSEIDRVFARLGGSQLAASDQRELRNIPRKPGATGSRTVEVVRLPARGATGGGRPRRTDFGVRAETWDDGFPAKSAPQPAPPPQPIAVEPAPEAVAHVMPMWERTAIEPVVEPAPPAPADAAPATAPPPAERARRQARSASRRVADPFDTSDDGANCLRCGYLIEPARERRGMMTCATCG